MLLYYTQFYSIECNNRNQKENKEDDVENVDERNDDDEEGPSSTWRDHIAEEMWNQYVAMIKLRK